MRKLTLIVVGLTGLCIFQIGVSRIIGASNTAPTFAAFLRHDAEIRNGVWCLRGICPDQTSIDEAKAAIVPLGGDIRFETPDSLQMYTQGYSVIIYNNQGSPTPVSGIKIDTLPFPLGDMIAEFGSPISVQPFSYPASWQYQRAIGFGKSLWAIVLCDQPGRIEPQCEVSEISVISHEIMPSTDGFKPWTGFVSFVKH